MTPQEVIQSFMASLRDNSSLSGTSMLDAAVKASSNYNGIQDAIDAMKVDQIAAEKLAVEEVLGSDYAGKTISEIDSTILNADAKTYDTNNIGNAYYNSANDNRTTVKRLINERKAIIFLEKYCGIQLSKNYWITSNDGVTSWNGDTTGNVDTGAITGSDANITLTAGDVVNDIVLTPEIMELLAEKYGVSLDGDKIIIGTGIEKTDRSIVPEIGNKYTATTSKAQNIKTGSNDWIVVATSADDTITTGGADSISAGAGNDSIIVGADYASINTGDGSDTVEISATVQNVTIKDLNSSDTIKISGTFDVGTAKIEDTMLVITDATGTRKIRLGDLTNAKEAKINSTTIADWLQNAGIDLNNLPTSSGKIISEPIETEVDIVSGEDGGGRIDIDPDYTPSPVPVETTKDTKGTPTRSSNSTGDINVNLDNVTLQSGDLQVDGSKVGTISNEFPNVSSYTKNGLTINLVGTTSNTDGSPSNFTKETFDQLTADQKTIVAGLFKWWAKESLQLNEESYGISFNSDTAMVKEIGLYFYDSGGSGNTLASVWNWYSGNKTTDLMLNVNMNYYSGIKADNFDGEGSGTSGFLDRTLAHEFTHAVMATNISYFNSLPKFIKEGFAELTHGIDDERGYIIFKIAYNAEWLDASLALDNTGTGSQDVGDGYAGGYMFLRYFAKQAALQSLFDDVVIPSDNPLYIRLTSNADDYTNTLDSATIMALGGDDTIVNVGENVSISGDAGNDYIYNEGSEATITGGAGNDKISLYSDSQSNLILYNAGDGNDIITGFNESSTLDIGGNKYSTTKSGNDLIINVINSGRITLANAATLSDLNIFGTFTEDTTPATEILTLTNSSSNAVTLDSTKKYADASARTRAIKIVGNTKNNSLVGSTGNDTLDGATGNDTLTGGNGADLFVYSAGNDVITDYATNDKISLASAYKNFAIDGTDVILGYGTNNSLRIEDGVNKSITSVLGKVTSVNIYTETGVFDGKKAAVTLASTSGDFDAGNYSALVTIDGAATNAIKITGNAKANRIIAGAKGSTLNGGAGSDTLTGGNGADVFAYEKNSGNDVITSYGAGDKISLGTGAKISDASTTKSSDSVLKFGKETLTVKNSTNVTITSDEGTMIYTGGVFSDTAKTSATLPATFAKEFSLGSYKNADSSGRTNAIKITGNTQNNSIFGGKGNDTLDGLTGNDTLSGGTGNDIFIYTGGKDVITDYGTGSDKISVASNLTYAGFAINGSDLILGYGTNNSLTVKNGKDKAININSVTKIYSDSATFDSKRTAVTLASTSGDFDATDYSALVTIDGAATNAIKITGNAKANRIIAGAKGSTLNGKAGNDTLTGGKGADIFAYEKNTGNDVIINYGASDKISLDAKITNASTNKAGDSILKIGNNSITIKSASELTLIEDGVGEMLYTGGVFTDSTKATATLPATFAKQFDLGTYKNADSSGRSDAIKITGNNYNNSIFGGKGNDTLDGGAGNDTLSGGSGADIFVYTGGNDFITDYETKDKISISGELVYSDYKLSGDNVVLSYNGNKSLTIQDGVNKAITSFTGKNTYVNVYKETGIFNTKNTATTLISSLSEFDAADYSALITINGSKTTGKVNIIGNGKANRIIASDFGATLNGGKGNDTLTGGAGTDIFIYEKASGNDLITNYGAGDKISLGSDAKVTDAFTKNSVSTIKIGSNTVTIKSADATFISDGVETIYSGGIFTTDDSAKVYGSFSGTINLDADITTADATLAKKAVTVQGGTGGDLISGGAANDKLYGNAGNDELHGGKGNDTLWGGAGNDEFIYKANEGNDVIADYASGDLLTILDKNGNDGETFKKATFGNNTLSLAINGGGNITLKNVNSSTAFNINGDSYHVSGKTIAK